MGYRGEGDVKTTYEGTAGRGVEKTHGGHGGVKLESRERPLPAMPQEVWEMSAGRRSVLAEMPAEAFGGRRSSATGHVWHEMDAGAGEVRPKQSWM